MKIAMVGSGAAGSVFASYLRRGGADMERAPILTYGRSGGNTLKNDETTNAIRALIGGLNK